MESTQEKQQTLTEGEIEPQLSQIDTSATQISDLEAKQTAKSSVVYDEAFYLKLNQMIESCEKNESIKKVEAFSILQAQIQDVFGSQNEELKQKVYQLSLNHLDHPLNTVAVISKSLVKKILHSIDDKQLLRNQYLPLIESLKIRGYKSRFIGLNIIIEYVDPFTYLEQNPGSISEIFLSTLEAVTTGKYVINFFETLLKKANGKSLQQEQRWFDIWINDYLSCLRSSNESLRDSVCSLITPIVIKINKNSLPYILSTLLSDSDSNSQRPLTTQTLDQLLTLMKIARSNKMLIIDETHIKLEAKCQQSLHQLKPDLPEFKFPHEHLLKLVMSENFKTCLDCIEIIAMEVKATSQISKFEYEMVNRFVRHCLRTTFPEFRQKYIKAVKQFVIRIRTAADKEIKKYVSSPEGTSMSPQVQEVVDFLKNLLDFIESNLYLDKPVEGALPLFELAKMIIELFGDFEYKLRITQIFPPCKLLSKTGLLLNQQNDGKSGFFIFLLNSLKSTWTQVRMYSFEILCRFPDDYPLFNDKAFVNEVILKTALDLANNPKAMLAEASAMFFNLLFKKCLSHMHFLEIREGQALSTQEMQLQFLRYVLDLINTRVKTFQVTLIKEGKKEALLHGLLSFFKYLFEHLALPEQLSREEFLEWRSFVKDLLSTCLNISQVCKGLISNNGLMSDAEGVDGAIGEIKVDCRGHPIKMDGMGEGVEYEDYENLILVGVWLAIKEDGLLLFNLLKWLDFPINKEDDTKLLTDVEIHQLCESFLDMLFNFKHRGAIEKAAETFSLFCQKLLQLNPKNSPDLDSSYYKSLPEKMLNQALEKITTENLSTILRRSAGIPPTIIAILRAEPISSEPILLNKTLDFLLALAKSQSEKEDSKIHALNIMRFIFQDAMLRHDVQRYITPAMILATESFSSNSWSIRNSALMAFTALTKRILNNLHVQDQDLSRTKGLSVFEFLTKYEELSQYFLTKLKEGIQQESIGKRIQKEEKDKQDLVIYSILLLISRLIPSFQLVEQSEDEESKQTQEQKKQQSNRFDKIEEYVQLIKSYGSNATYFVRKISAQALLPLIRFDTYIEEVQSCFKQLQSSVSEGGKKLRQNQAHGLFIRLHVFESAYFQYRDIVTKQLGPGHYEDLHTQRLKEETILSQLFEEFDSQYFQNCESSGYSRISLALYVKSLCKATLKLGSQSQLGFSKDFVLRYRDRFQHLLLEIKKDGQLNSENQILLQQIARLLIVLSLKKLKFNNDSSIESTSDDEKDIFEVFQAITNEFTTNYCDFVYTFLTQFKSLVSQIIEYSSQSIMDSLITQISNASLRNLVDASEKYCKVVETLLIIAFKLLKKNTHRLDAEFASLLLSYYQRLESNPSILSQLIKLLTLALKNQFTSQEKKSDLEYLEKISSILYQYSDMEHKEQVRIAVSKSLATLLEHMKIQDGSVFVSSPQAFRAFNRLFSSLILLLNDEQPDIRYYLCHSGLTKLIQNESANNFTIQSGSQEGENIVVSLNDEVVQELLFEDVTQRILSLENQDLIIIYAEEFLLKQQILTNHYREHLEKNFDDKIFFFEPINKFYDLLWVKKLAFKALVSLVTSNPQISLLRDFNIEELTQRLRVELANFYKNENMLKQNSTSYENLAQQLMILRLARGNQLARGLLEELAQDKDQIISIDKFISNISS